MTNQDIADAAGLARSTVMKLQTLECWDRVPVATMFAFAAACGVDLWAPGKHILFWKRRKMAYLSSGTTAQKRMFVRLMGELRASTDANRQ